MPEAPRETSVTVPPIPPESTGAVVFGGTFDPPTVAHIQMARASRDEMAPGSWLLFVPAARSPHKQEGPSASDADRLTMLHAAIASCPRASIWTDELDRARGGAAPSYMIESLRRLGAARPGLHLRLLIGADQAVAFARWRSAREIIELAEPIVMLRAPSETGEALLDAMRTSGAWSDAELAQWAGRIASIPARGASATEAREILEGLAGGGLEQAQKERLNALLAPEVLEIIADRGLYRS